MWNLRWIQSKTSRHEKENIKFICCDCSFCFGSSRTIHMDNWNLRPAKQIKEKKVRIHIKFWIKING